MRTKGHKMHIRLHHVQPKAGYLPSCLWLGTVEADGQSGALMEVPGHGYRMVRQGKAWPLDADAVAVALADAMTRAPGRPLTAAGKLERFTVLLSTDDATLARKLGDGNLSAGLRAALRAHVFPTDGSP